MTDAVIFSGPTLPCFKIEEAFNCMIHADKIMQLDNGKKIAFRPPVAEGDILRLVQQKPKIIGIIDGYFENVPAVWHKEILFAMSQGISVLGSSSMGALRASELAAFGMQGIGIVYQQFAEGLLEDDDEVTVMHGPAELGFPLFSEAMVNIRSTLNDALAAGIITDTERKTFTHLAKQLHYKERNYSRMMASALKTGVDAYVIDRLEKWIETSHKDQKLIDAIHLVKTVINNLENSVKKETFFTFESTYVWERSRSQF